MKVKFLRTEIYETLGPGKGPKYEAGKIYELRQDLADRWINRGAAQDASEAQAEEKLALSTAPEEKPASDQPRLSTPDTASGRSTGKARS